MGDGVETMRDHWWWRPGFRVGRKSYAWHLTFDDAPDLHRLARAYAPLVARPGLDPVPVRWLHLTLQTVGFTDEIPDADIDAIASAAGRHLAGLAPFEATLGPPTVQHEAVLLDATPAEPITQVWRAVRAGIADVLGPDRVPDETFDFIPHVSLAYSNAATPTAPLRRALAATTVPPATAPITAATLIALDRDHHQYRWTTHSRVPLGTPTADRLTAGGEAPPASPSRAPHHGR